MTWPMLPAAVSRAQTRPWDTRTGRRGRRKEAEVKGSGGREWCVCILSGCEVALSRRFGRGVLLEGSEGTLHLSRLAW